MTNTEQATVDPLDSFAKIAAAHPEHALQLLFWKHRHQNPEFVHQITPADLKGFNDCVTYLDVKPTVRIFRPQGLPDNPGQEARGNRRAIPPRAGTPPKDFVVIQMVDSAGNSIVPIENNEEDQDRGKQAREVARMREQAPGLADLLLRQAASGDFSTSTLQEAASMLKALAKA